MAEHSPLQPSASRLQPSSRPHRDLLLADYPEVCYPIQALDGISNRANGQLYQGKRTQIGWTAKEIVLPTIADSKASGAIIKVAGLTGRIRGMKFKRPDGNGFGAKPPQVIACCFSESSSFVVAGRIMGDCQTPLRDRNSTSQIAFAFLQLAAYFGVHSKPSFACVN